MKLKITKIDIRDVTPERGDYRRYNSKLPSRVYIFIKNDSRDKPLSDVLTGFRYNKPYQLYRAQVMPAVLKAMGLPEDTKMSWSQYAGCSCPCSPGFRVAQNGGQPKNVFVDVEWDEVQNELSLTK